MHSLALLVAKDNPLDWSHLLEGVLTRLCGRYSVDLAEADSRLHCEIFLKDGEEPLDRLAVFQDTSKKLPPQAIGLTQFLAHRYCLGGSNPLTS